MSSKTLKKGSSVRKIEMDTISLSAPLSRVVFALLLILALNAKKSLHTKSQSSGCYLGDCPACLLWLKHSKRLKNVLKEIRARYWVVSLVCSLLEDLLWGHLVGDGDCPPSLRPSVPRDRTCSHMEDLAHL